MLISVDVGALGCSADCFRQAAESTGWQPVLPIRDLCVTRGKENPSFPVTSRRIWDSTPVNRQQAHHSYESAPMKKKTHPSQAPFLTSIFVALASLSFPATTVVANTIALDFTTNGALEHGGDFTRGWDFTLTNDILVTDLGLWDAPQPGGGTLGDGFADSHTVSIWTSTGTLVTSTIIPAGMSGTLMDDFRYVSIAPTLLVAGSYVIGGHYTGLNDYVAAQPSGITTAPELTYGGPRRGSGDAFPTSTPSGSGLFGPNFQFVSAINGNAVPEGGATLLLLTTALSALAAFRWRVFPTPVSAGGRLKAGGD